LFVARSKTDSTSKKKARGAEEFPVRQPLETHRRTPRRRYSWSSGSLLDATSRLPARKRYSFSRARPRLYDVETGEIVWQTRLGTSVQGFPITYRANGKQYVAIPTGLGGGSPRRVPGLIAPDINHPTTGNGLYIFALP